MMAQISFVNKIMKQINNLFVVNPAKQKLGNKIIY